MFALILIYCLIVNILCVLCRFQVQKFAVPWRNAKVYFYLVNKQIFTILVYLVAIFWKQCSVSKCFVCFAWLVMRHQSSIQSGFTLTTRDEANFVHFKCFFPVPFFPGHQVPTPTLSSSKGVFRVIAINRYYVVMQILAFLWLILSIVREKYD